MTFASKNYITLLISNSCLRVYAASKTTPFVTRFSNFKNFYFVKVCGWPNQGSYGNRVKPYSISRIKVLCTTNISS